MDGRTDMASMLGQEFESPTTADIEFTVLDMAGPTRPDCASTLSRSIKEPTVCSVELRACWERMGHGWAQWPAC